MISLHEPDWNSENAEELRDFLRSQTGARMLSKLAYLRPSFLSSNAHPHKSFANSREVHGYEQAVKMLLSLTEAEEQPLSEAVKLPPSQYPDLDDETQWAPENPVEK